MAINTKHLEQERKKLAEENEAKLAIETYKWETFFDKWLKKYPNGGVYRFWWFFGPSSRCKKKLEELYSSEGWAVYFGCMHGPPGDYQYVLFEVRN